MCLLVVALEMISNRMYFINERQMSKIFEKNCFPRRGATPWEKGFSKVEDTKT